MAEGDLKEVEDEITGQMDYELCVELGNLMAVANDDIKEFSSLLFLLMTTPLTKYMVDQMLG